MLSWRHTPTKTVSSGLYAALQQYGRFTPKRPSFADKQVRVMSMNISNPSSLGKRGAQPSRPVMQRAAARRQSWLDRFRAWRATRAEENELYALSDRDLRDIGLTRYDVRAAVRGELPR
jgi:uncharacterized protein YjiS (DUF1127 family)